MLSITKIVEFSASHRLYQPQWSAAENAAVFGKCSNPAGHGHNYRLEVTVTGTLDPSSGMIVNAASLKRLLEDSLLTDLDHCNLNSDVPWLKDKLPTVEVLLEAIGERLEELLGQQQPPLKLQRLKLWETSTVYACRESV